MFNFLWSALRAHKDRLLKVGAIGFAVLVAFILIPFERNWWLFWVKFLPLAAAFGFFASQIPGTSLDAFWKKGGKFLKFVVGAIVFFGFIAPQLGRVLWNFTKELDGGVALATQEILGGVFKPTPPPQPFTSAPVSPPKMVLSLPMPVQAEKPTPVARREPSLTVPGPITMEAGTSLVLRNIIYDNGKEFFSTMDVARMVETTYVSSNPSVVHTGRDALGNLFFGNLIAESPGEADVTVIHGEFKKKIHVTVLP